MISQDLTRRFSQGQSRRPGGERPEYDVGHIIDVSPGHDTGVLEMDTGERVTFVVVGCPEGDALDLHIGDHAWVTKLDAAHASRELVCPRRNKTLRIQLS